MKQETLREALRALNEALSPDQSRADLVGVVEGVVRLKLSGALCYCASSTLELHREVEGFLRERVPGLERVESE